MDWWAEAIKNFCDLFNFSAPMIFTGVFKITFVNQIKYQPNIELSFLKKYFGKSSKGKPTKHMKIIPKYIKILKIRDLVKITLN